jgi:hypothetical protein
MAREERGGEERRERDSTAEESKASRVLGRKRKENPRPGKIKAGERKSKVDWAVDSNLGVVHDRSTAERGEWQLNRR